ncbi:F-box/FBD/LRR-repeat protein At5g22660-like [Chenopodium quinoa]|uniref:F-box domain-containing protein n=1 Tax=Chenopodium quinoa TaxID=63459 RepID=A0A803LYY6_CHEQI|nr:F-box/FBD/LRR-repeat protein At5g22660-like [Chenopodium quinoa]
MEKLRMGDCKTMKYYVRKRPRRSSEEEEDRLRSLPDAILTDILSRLSIHSAATTSVLSHRWRRLWTGVTRVNLNVYSRSKSTDKISYILRQLTCRKLRHFGLTLEEWFHSPAISVSEAESLFFQVCSRNVENISVNAGYDVSFSLPAFLFNSQSLVTLTILGLLELPKIKDLCVHLPNLKKLSLDQLDDVPLCLETLIKSSSLLEHLDLVFNLDMSSHVVNIIASNLKSLSITMLDSTRDTRVYIDAPKLVNLKIEDWSSIYYFLRNPSTLVKACIGLNRVDGYFLELEDEEEDEQGYGSLSGPRKEYICQMTKFVGGLSSVSKLELKLDSWTNNLRYFNYVNMPIFSNLTCLETNCFKDLLTSLNCFPNLEHLEVCLKLSDDIMEKRNWCAPDSVPDCLVSKLKTILITGLKGIDDELRLLAYILSNAILLEKLLVQFCTVDGAYIKNEREKAYAVWKECQFCRSMLNLPRSSSTCEVVVSGTSVTASGNAVEGKFLTCQIYLSEYT